MKDSPVIACPVCGASMQPDWKDERLEVRLCHHCGHRVAAHANGAPEADYHAQYDQDEFVKALATTRFRQANRILKQATAIAGNPGAWLDFGSGRAFLLQTLKEAGITPIAGVDSSEIARELLHRAGIEALPCMLRDGRLQWNRAGLSFEPQVLSLLDVIEHFPVDSVGKNLREILEQLSSLVLVVIKVPMSQGLLYRTSQALRPFSRAPLHQLYQVGTFPPHSHYFSRQSLTRLVEGLHLRIVNTIDDPDFDSLVGRVNVLRRRKWISGVLDPIARGACRRLGSDSTILFCRPQQAIRQA
jgi:hypothetical protein